MSGWKSIVSGAGLIATGVGLILTMLGGDGEFSGERFTAGVTLVGQGLAVLGIAHKIEKAGNGS